MTGTIVMTMDMSSGRRGGRRGVLELEMQLESEPEDRARDGVGGEVVRWVVEDLNLKLQEWWWSLGLGRIKPWEGLRADVRVGYLSKVSK
jgi:hypothetical protein